MGSIYCCDHDMKKPKIENIIVDVDYNSIETFEKPLKSVFKISIPQKITQIKFAESHKVKRYKLKYKKRLLLATDNNQIHLISYYLGNLLFLLNSLVINEKYSIISIDFLSNKNSSHIAITIEDNNKLAKILVLNLEKLLDKPPIEVNAKQSIVKNNEPEDTNSGRTNDSGIQNNIVERMINSTDNSMSSSNENNDDEVFVLRKYESNVKSGYFKVLNRSFVQDIFPDNVLLVKYDHYINDLKLVIEEENLANISQIKVKDYHIFAYSQHNSVIRCLKINKSHFFYKVIYEVKLSVEEPYLDNILFPIRNENVIIVEKLNFLNLNNEKVSCSKNFQSFFDFKGSFTIINFTKIVDYITQYKLNNGNWLNIKKKKKEITAKEEEESKESRKSHSLSNNSNLIMTFIITGMCRGNNMNNENMEENRFLSVFVYNTSIDTVSEFEKSRSKIRILNKTPEITDISFGPFDNGPIITGHVNGYAYIWSLFDLSLISIIHIFDNCPINFIINEPFGMSLFCNKDKGTIQSLHIIDKKSEYFYHESTNGKLTRIQRTLLSN